MSAATLYVGVSNRTGGEVSGLYRRPSDGDNWSLCGLPPRTHVHAVSVHPEDPNVVYVAASSGVHDGAEVLKLLLAGADVVMTTSALLRHGPEHIVTMERYEREWMTDAQVDEALRPEALIRPRVL